MGALALGTLVIIIGGLLYVKRKSLEFLYNRTYWAIGALVSHYAVQNYGKLLCFTLTMLI